MLTPHPTEDHLEMLRLRSELAGLKTDLTFEKFILALKYNEAQLRAPAGTPIGGQWVKFLSGLARFIPNPIARRAAMGGLALYSALAGREEETRIPAIEFRAGEFTGERDSNRSLSMSSVRDMERDEVDRFCPRFGEVQERTDRITARVDAELPDLNSQNRGTEIHYRLKKEIDEMRNPDFITERSFLKEEGIVHYGQKGSIRVDVLENVGNGTVCVYDIKTGRAALSGPRMAEIALRTFANFPATTRIIVTEVRQR